MNTQDVIIQFIVDELCGGTRTALDPDEPLIASGILDSLGLLRLITFIEQQFNLSIGDGDVGSENFDTVRKITNFLETKRAQSS